MWCELTEEGERERKKERVWAARAVCQYLWWLQVAKWYLENMRWNRRKGFGVALQALEAASTGKGIYLLSHDHWEQRGRNTTPLPTISPIFLHFNTFFLDNERIDLM